MWCKLALYGGVVLNEEKKSCLVDKTGVFFFLPGSSVAGLVEEGPRSACDWREALGCSPGDLVCAAAM